MINSLQFNSFNLRQNVLKNRSISLIGNDTGLKMKMRLIKTVWVTTVILFGMQPGTHKACPTNFIKLQLLFIFYHLRTGKYMQMMNILKPIAFDVIHCVSQLFDYYLYAVYTFFGRNDMVQYFESLCYCLITCSIFMLKSNE